jgi:hypothetical protein
LSAQFFRNLIASVGSKAVSDLRHLRAAQANTVKSSGVAYLYFIAHSAKSMRVDQKESRIEANGDSETRNRPKTERTESFDEKNRREKRSRLDPVPIG